MKKRSSILIIGILTLIGFVAVSEMRMLPFGSGVQDFTVNLVNGYKLNRTSSHSVFISPEVWGGDIPSIPSKVIRLEVSGDVIIAERQKLKRRNPNDSLDTYLIPDSSKTDYWILDTREETLRGHLSKEELKKVLDSLDITSDIKLKEVSSFNNF
ncbi:MAG: DUF3997 domain-containing protein [Rufibacter sp.]